MRTDPIRTAFTLIELMVVVGTFALMAGLSVGGVVRSLRAASFNQAVSAIQEVATQARLLALRCSDPQLLHGVDIARRDSGQLTVRLVRMQRSDAASTTILERTLPSSSEAWVEGTRLGDDAAVTAVTWWYQACTGLPMGRDGSGFLPPGTTVGAPAPVLQVSGFQLYGVPADYHAPALFPSLSPDAPGLSVRSRDGSLHLAIAVYANGGFSSGTF